MAVALVMQARHAVAVMAVYRWMEACAAPTEGIAILDESAQHIRTRPFVV
jgi:hypothetical protein